MTIDEFRSNPGRASMWRRVMDMDIVKEAFAAVEETNGLTEEAAIAANLSADAMVECRLLNQQKGRRGFVKDLELCSIAIKPVAGQQPANYGADDAAEHLATVGQPWGVDPATEQANL